MNRKVVTSLIAIAVIGGLMLSAHILVNYVNVVEVLKRMHGG